MARRRTPLPAAGVGAGLERLPRAHGDLRVGAGRRVAGQGWAPGPDSIEDRGRAVGGDVYEVDADGGLAIGVDVVAAVVCRVLVNRTRTGQK